MRSRNFVVKALVVDVIATSHTTSTFNMADVNIQERDSLMATPTFKNKRWRPKGMQEKESIVVV